MADLDFPSSPTNGQTYSLNGTTYYYDSTVGAWLTKIVSSTYDIPAVFSVANASFGKANNALANTSGVFAGDLTLTGNVKVDTSFTTKTIREANNTLSANTIDLSQGSYFTKTISGTTTLSVSNVPNSGNAVSIILDLTNGGSGTITWWSNVKWTGGGTAPTLTVSGRDVLGFFTYDGGVTWTGFVIGKDAK